LVPTRADAVTRNVFGRLALVRTTLTQAPLKPEPVFPAVM
jgi:hypothetical protein